jgi:hypothetical protein
MDVKRIPESADGDEMPQQSYWRCGHDNGLSIGRRHLLLKAECSQN